MQEISAEGALSPKEKTQLFSDKCSSDENSASQGLSQDNESNGMQILHPSPQAEEATTQLSAVAQSAGGNEQKKNFVNELAPSSLAQPVGMLSPRSEHQNYERQNYGQRFGLASSMNQATGMFQHQVQQYYDNGYEDAPSQANGTIQHHAQLPYEHDYGHSSVVEEPTSSIYPLEDLEKTQNEAFQHYNDGN
jgi:hypothetical protein